MKKGQPWLLAALVLLVAGSTAACSSKLGGEPAEAQEVGQAASLTPSPTQVVLAAPTQTPSNSVGPAAPAAPRLITSTPTPLPPTPTETPIPSATPAWQEHVVAANENCVLIATRYGHNDFGAVTAIEQLNGIQCTALRQGQTIKVPFPTPTPTQIGMDLTQTAVATNAPPMVNLEAISVVAVQDYVIQAGDSLQGIAWKNGSTMRQICELNPLPDGLNCSTCQWQDANCCCSPAPLVVEGKVLNVPAPSPTPSPSPTFTGNETPTMTPTFRAPEPISPREGASVSDAVRLTWLSVGVLQPGEQYYVRLVDETAGTVYEAVTNQLSLDVPRSLLVNDGQVHTFAWQVVVVRTVEDGFIQPISQAVVEQRFAWEGWRE